MSYRATTLSNDKGTTVQHLGAILPRFKIINLYLPFTCYFKSKCATLREGASNYLVHNNMTKKKRCAINTTLKHKDRFDIYPCNTDAALDTADRTCHKFKVENYSFHGFLTKFLDATLVSILWTKLKAKFVSLVWPYMERPVVGHFHWLSTDHTLRQHYHPYYNHTTRWYSQLVQFGLYIIKYHNILRY